QAVATSATMTGLSVTVNLIDTGSNATSSETVAWSATAVGGAPGVQGTVWSLAQTGDTGLAGANWTLTDMSQTLAITSVILNGLPGATVFDRSTDIISSPLSGAAISVGTPDSDAGGDYTFVGEIKGIRRIR